MNLSPVDAISRVNESVTEMFSSEQSVVPVNGKSSWTPFSVVIQGYRSDFTNTIVGGGKPNADQQRLYDLCMAAPAPGEKELHAAASCLTVYRAVRNVFDKAGVGHAFPHHAGHGFGITHTKDPYRRQAREPEPSDRRCRRPVHRRNRRHSH
jgi:Xaa-Pro aminopeptidase